MFEGYLELGGNEVANNDRVIGYTKSADCPITWIKCAPCGTMAEALGDAPYDVSQIDDAPWYDVSNIDVSSRFYGVLATDVSGVHDSTRSVQMTQSIGDGGVFGVNRHGMKKVRVRATVFAHGRDALDYGLNWLNATLEPGACGQHGTACGVSDFGFLVQCPPERQFNYVTEPVGQPVVNHVTNYALRGTETVNIAFNGLREANPNNSWYRSINNVKFRHSAVPGTVFPQELSDVGMTTYMGPSGVNIDAGYSLGFKATELIPGNTYTAFMWVRNPYAKIQFGLYASTNPPNFIETLTEEIEPSEEGTFHRFTFVASGVNNYILATQTEDATAPNAAFDVSAGAYIEGDYTGPYFSGLGVSPNESDFTVVQSFWDGRGYLQGVAVDGFVATDAAAIMSTRNGKPAVRLIPLSLSEPGGTVEFPLPPGMVSTGGEYMLSMTLENEQTNPIASSRSLHIGSDSVSAPNTVGTHELRLSFESGLSVATVEIGGVQGSGDIWLSDFGAFDAGYQGDYFNGDTEDNLNPDNDAVMAEYSWIGTPGESESQAQFFEVVAYEDPERYAELNRQNERYLHDTQVTSGLLVRNYYEMHGVNAAEVEFTVTSERGYVYGKARRLQIFPTVDAVEDVATNLIRNPSAETPGPDVTRRINLAENPSLEVNGDGWSGAKPAFTSFITNSRVQNKPRAAGDWSYEVTVEHTGTSNPQGTLRVVAEISVPEEFRNNYVTLGIWASTDAPTERIIEFSGTYRSDVVTAYTAFDTATNLEEDKTGKYFVSELLPIGGSTQILLSAIVTVSFTPEDLTPISLFADAAMAIIG